MANIAQMINVLQAMILTDKDQMVLTPTYHVFDMYQVFQDATQLPLEIETGSYAFGKLLVPTAQCDRGAQYRRGRAHWSCQPGSASRREAGDCAGSACLRTQCLAAC